MPVKLRKLPSGKVQVRTPGGIKSRGSTPANAERQKQLLNAVDHGFKPDREKLKRKVMGY